MVLPACFACALSRISNIHQNSGRFAVRPLPRYGVHHLCPAGRWGKLRILVPFPVRDFRAMVVQMPVLLASTKAARGINELETALARYRFGLDREVANGKLKGGWGRSQRCPRNRGLGLRLGSAASHPNRLQQ